MSVIGLTGKGGGFLAPLCDVCFIAPGSNADRIQRSVIKIIHTLIEVEVERELFLKLSFLKSTFKYLLDCRIYIILCFLSSH